MSIKEAYFHTLSTTGLVLSSLVSHWL